MKALRFSSLALFLATVFAMMAPPVSAYPLFRSAEMAPPPGVTLFEWIDSLSSLSELAPLRMIEPADGALVPVDAASPIFRWEADPATAWLVTLSVQDAPICQGVVDTPHWVPDQRLWERIKADAGGQVILATVSGIGPDNTLFSRGATTLAVSQDPVSAQIAFLRNLLPFRKAKDNPRDSQMLLGDPASYGMPRVVMQDQPVCFNCHAYSADGSTYGLDMDYKGDKGGYVLSPVRERLLINDGNVISWNSYKAPKPAKYSMGLFTSFSSDGRYAASTVGESSVFVMLDDLSFSQMFYPATGQIAIYDRDKGVVAPLPGADDTGLIQTSPAFTPDISRIAFARAPVKPELVAAIEAGALRREDPTQNIVEVNEKYPMQFSLYSIPFNNGRGGEPEPIAGAADNGMSNFFPRFSPDGKWLVFTQCRSGLVLQPDSRLVILPAQGGEPRVLEGNTGLMNSWHSWSPNSRWLAFAAKGNSPFTEIYLTHIDEHGRSSPSLRLFRFSHPEMAAMVPEFVPTGAGVTQKTMELADPEGAVGQSMAIDGR
ncbi:MAG: hypothetical protein ABIK45_03515 [Pseudomonadota bacterium]